MPVTESITGRSSQNIACLLRDAARRAPTGVAVVEESGNIRYAELWGRAAAFTLALREAGIRPGDRVAIFLERDSTAVAAYFGVLAAGGIAVIINETMRPRQLEYTLSHSGASLLLTSAELLTRQPRRLEIEVPVLDVAGVDTMREVEPLTRESADLAQIIYTSGSTGQPKGVMLTHGNLGSAIAAVTSYLAITDEDRTAALLPFSSVYGLNQLLCAIHQASTLVLAASPLPQRLVEKLRRAEVTVLAAVPPLWLQLLTAPGFATPIDSLRILQNAGGHLPEHAIRRLRLQQPQARLFLQYGLTEVIRSTYLPPEEVDRRPTSIGRAIPGAEILVLRDDGAPCAPGEVGELVHRGPTVAAGYWNDPGASAAVFRPDPFRKIGSSRTENAVFSGDLVWRDEEGFLYFVGRRDRMIKILGYRVSPDEITNVIYASTEVVEAVVTAEPNEQRGARITAYVVLRPGGSVERLAAFCGIELPRYMQPTRIEVRDALPRTTRGKHDLSALTATPIST